MNLPYTEEVVKPLKELFAQDDIAQIPQLKIKTNNDLRLIADALKTEITISGDTEAFNPIATYMDDDANLSRLQNIEYISKDFASSIENNFHYITTKISKQVAELKDKIIARYKTLMTREKSESLLDEHIEPTESDYQFINWTGLRSAVRQAEIVDTACANAKLVKQELSALNLSYIAKKVSFATEYSSRMISPEAVNTITEKLIAAFVSDTSITKEQVNVFVAMITNRERYINYCLRLEGIMLHSKDLANDCIKVNADAIAFQKLSDAYGRLVGGELNDDTFSATLTNVEAFRKTNTASLYWLLYVKDVKFANKLIITPNVLNRTVYEEFVQDGNNIVTVHNYLKAFDKVVPTSGIDAKTVKETDIAEKLVVMSAKLKSEEKYIKHKCLVDAYNYVMNEFAKDTLSEAQYPVLRKTIGVTEFNNRIKLKASTLGGNVAKLDNALYDVIIGLHNKPNITKLCGYLDRNFTKLATEATEDITEQQILESQCDATIEMIADYLFDTVVE